MKTTINLIFITVVLFLTSCATTVKFPISNVTPAAEISANIDQDKNENCEIELTALHMASPNRLNPPKNIYVVWIVTQNNSVLNIGQLSNKKNADKLSLKATTPFVVKEIFITAEDRGGTSFPSGIEISRAVLAVK